MIAFRREPSRNRTSNIDEASSSRRPALLTAWAAVSVCETILNLTGIQAKIKWPNDVLIRGKKVCGILIEQSRGTVIGEQ